MARIRTIKPEALLHRKVGRLSDRALRVWLALLTQADDEGRVVADTAQVKLWAFGYQMNARLKKIEAAIQEVATSGLIQLYVVNGTRYANFPSWKDHQKIDRPSKSKLPPPPFDESSTNPQRVLGEHSTGIGSDQGSDQGSDRRGGERGGEPGAARSASPPQAAPLAAPGEAGNGDGQGEGVRALVGDLADRKSMPIEIGTIDKSKIEAQKKIIGEMERRARGTGA